MALAYRLGSPPRVRSRPADPDDAGISVGITSACAEQTTTTTLWAEPPGDHLRVCGADTRLQLTGQQPQGSPPRVRSRPPSIGCGENRSGITSACAEQTPLSLCSLRSRWDHLRVCGADISVKILTTIVVGSPPRVRSRRPVGDLVPCGLGITSACAEQTPSSGRRSIRNWDHLRVCGADAMRKRRRFRRQWITSACAEQTRRSRSASPAYRDHLRVCGADHWVGGGRRCLRGSPPRVRSRLLRPRRG